MTGYTENNLDIDEDVIVKNVIPFLHRGGKAPSAKAETSPDDIFEEELQIDTSSILDDLDFVIL